MFAIERRNHSKTGVYGDLCVRVPVDTPIAVDKLKKAKKGLKYERFDSFSHICPIESVDHPWRSNRHGMRYEGDLKAHADGDDGDGGRKCRGCRVGRSEASWSDLGREASKMDGHPIGSTGSIRGQKSDPFISSAHSCVALCSALPGLAGRSFATRQFKPSTSRTTRKQKTFRALVQGRAGLDSGFSSSSSGYSLSSWPPLIAFQLRVEREDRAQLRPRDALVQGGTTFAS